MNRVSNILNSGEEIGNNLKQKKWESNSVQRKAKSKHIKVGQLTTKMRAQICE